jgi:hypothetical protein
MDNKKPFWDVEEEIGFINVKSNIDKHYYKVWDAGTHETIQQVADILASIRRDLNTLLKNIYANKETWENDPIAFGIYHMFDIHCPNGNEYSFNYQEMTPNKDGILGLNKPKIIDTIQIPFEGKLINYEISSKRSIFLTIRPQINSNPNKFDTYSKILDLAIHEITHTICNDVRWKEDNHKHPYPVYHKRMRKWATDFGIKQ